MPTNLRQASRLFGAYVRGERQIPCRFGMSLSPCAEPRGWRGICGHLSAATTKPSNSGKQYQQFLLVCAAPSRRTIEANRCRPIESVTSFDVHVQKESGPMHATPFVLRGLLACTAVAPLLLGGSAVATAQSNEEDPTGVLVVTEIPIGTVQLSPSLPTGDLTGEGTLIGVPSGPVTVAPAPVATAPQPEAADPVGNIGPIPDHASIWDPIFQCLETDTLRLC
jgi:hypothetical protein